MPRRCLLLAAAALVLCTSLPAASVGAPVPRGVEDASSLEWRDCHGDAQCAELEVPLDDTVPNGPTITLALVRYRALDPSRRIGSLVINNGGPGASAVEYVVGAASSLPSRIRDRFDIVGFDPRGVGASDAIDCTEDLDPYFDAEWSPDDEAERAELAAATQELVQACVETSGDVLRYLGTDRVARDLDLIRAALGDDKLTYLGYSYGTLIGQWYAEQFPDRVRALVFDGVVDPALESADFEVQQASGFDHALELFFENCARDEDCAFHSGGRPGRAYDRLRARVGDRDLPVEDEPDRALNGTRFDLAIAQLLYEGRSAWGELARALASARDGDGSDLLSYADFYTGREGDAAYLDTQEAFIAISCADGPPVGDATDFQAIEEAAADAAPRLGRTIVNGSLPCAFWPFEPSQVPSLRARGAPPLLLVSTEDDPATPLSWARSVEKQIRSAVLVRVRGESHTSFPGSSCVDAIVVRYLIRRDVPDRGTRC